MLWQRKNERLRTPDTGKRRHHRVLVKETGWQKHSVRGFLAGTVRKKLKLPLVSEKIDGVRNYRIGAAKTTRINKTKRSPTAQKG